LEKVCRLLHPVTQRFRQRTKFLVSGFPKTLLDLAYVNKQGSTFVDLALRFEVLALCAVFAFVGAILLGAF
jgi:hypothetical protein